MSADPVTKCARIAFPICGATRWKSDVAAIRNALAAVAGVTSVTVNPALEMAYLQYDPHRCGMAEFAAALEPLGLRTGEASLRSLEQRD